MSVTVAPRRVLHHDAGEGRALWFIHNLAVVRVDGDESGGRLGVVELRGAPGDMPPLHVHRDDDETFVVLEGRMRFWAPGRETELGPGGSILLPRALPHTYRVVSGTPATWLVIGAPAGFERFVAEVGEPAPRRALPPADRPVDAVALAESAARYGIEILGPPGALPA